MVLLATTDIARETENDTEAQFELNDTVAQFESLRNQVSEMGWERRELKSERELDLS